jgi:hypothetical protein
MQATLDNSSKDNAADQAKDQAAQLQYLRECLSFASQERDQLLTMNQKLTAMLVQQTRQVAAAAAAAAAAAVPAAAEEGSGALEASCSSSSAQGAGAGGLTRAGKRAAGLRRCLSYEVGCVEEGFANALYWELLRSEACRHTQLHLVARRLC